MYWSAFRVDCRIGTSRNESHPWSAFPIVPRRLARGARLEIICDMLEDYFSDLLAERDYELEQQVNDALGWADGWTVTGMGVNPASPDLRSQFPNAISEWMDKWARRHGASAADIARSSPLLRTVSTSSTPPAWETAPRPPPSTRTRG